MKRQPINRDKVFANLISNKGFISKIYNELLKPISKKQTKKQTGKRHKNTFHKRGSADGEQAHKKSLK